MVEALSGINKYRVSFTLCQQYVDQLPPAWGGVHGLEGANSASRLECLYGIRVPAVTLRKHCRPHDRILAITSRLKCQRCMKRGMAFRETAERFQGR